MDITEYNYKSHYERFAPGDVGPVGAVMMSTQMKRSFPDAALRWTPAVSGQNEKYFGSNVQDGQSPSFTSGGGGARVIERPYRKQIVIGDRYQDLSVPDKFVMPEQGEIHNLDWAGKLAFNYDSQRTGNKYGGVRGYQIRDGGIPVGVMRQPTNLDNSDSATAQAPSMIVPHPVRKGFMK